jgi:hypothetical protein
VRCQIFPYVFLVARAVRALVEQPIAIDSGFIFTVVHFPEHASAALAEAALAAPGYRRRKTGER